ncbi:MAG TPA: 50S ribosomal protein L13e [Candidatus Atribacteria bacterium]|nr:50S ribosomal protein L13e [Candidatus Atribacteria bacterium]
MEKPIPKVKPPALIRYGKVIKNWRIGRGFSIGELKEAGLTVTEARKLGLRIDKRRKSVHKENVEAIRKYIGKIKETKKEEKPG